MIFFNNKHNEKKEKKHTNIYTIIYNYFKNPFSRTGNYLYKYITFEMQYENNLS